MPLKVRNVKNTKYGYYQWGKLKKYYFIKNDIYSRILAREKALRQARAIWVQR